MRIRLAVAPVVGVVLSALCLSSCGGDSGGNPTQPSVPVTTVLAQASSTIAAPGCTAVIVGNRLVITCGGSRSQDLPSFTTTAVGRIEFLLDWTFASNDLDAVLRQGSTEVGRTNSTTTKPERLQLENMAAGTYTPVVLNYGPTQESFSYQILFTH